MSSSPAKRRPQPSNRSARASAASASARARLQAEQARAQRRRRQLLLVVVPVALVLVVVATLVVVKLTGRGSTVSGAGSTPAADDVITAVTSVPTSVLDQVGAGSISAVPKKVDAPALTENGKPKVLYVGAEYCPFCAAERWAVVVAMSRFGTFTNLGQTASSAQDSYPSTPTLTFHGASYTSSTVAFTGVELNSNEVSGGQYAKLDTLTATDQETFSTFNSPPYVDAGSAGSIPFVDIGGRYLISGASYNPQVLQGKTHAEVAAALADPTSEIAQSVDGTANVITAAVCASTDQKPAAVCTSAGVVAAAKRLS